MISLRVSEFDQAVMKLTAALPAGLRPFFELVSYIGHPVTVAAIGFLIVVSGIFMHKPAIFFSGTFVWLTSLISTLLKNTTERTRPLTDYVAGMHVHSYSFPSGHTAGSTIAFGLLAYYSYHLLPSPFNYICLVVFALLILLIGISRIYLGAHFPTDVMGGWVLGGIFLLIAICVLKPLS